LLERAVELEVNAVRIYVYNVGGTALKAFKKNRQSGIGET
jgi:hypothetical protein